MVGPAEKEQHLYRAQLGHVNLDEVLAPELGVLLLKTRKPFRDCLRVEKGTAEACGPLMKG
jgi:hypothetical protein